MRQNTNEKIDSFLTRLNGVASKCNFGSANLLDDNLVDQLIKGVASDDVRKKFLDVNPDELTLDRAMNIAKTAEATSQHINDLAQLGAISISLHSMRRTGQQHTDSKSCPNCGGQPHDRNICPAGDKWCNKCKKLGHYGQVCRSTAQHTSQPPHPKQPSRSYCSQKQQKRSQRQVHFVSQDTDPVNTKELNSVVFDSINKNTPCTEAHTVIKIEPYVGRNANWNTGTQENILPLRTYKKILPNSLTPDGCPTRSQPSEDGLTAYNGSLIQHYGTITMPCSYNDSDWVDTTFYVVETPGPVMFGLPTGITLNLLQMNCNVNVSSQQGIRSKRPKTKTFQVICQNVLFLVSQNVPSIFSLYLIKLEVANISCPKVKTSQVKTSQSQNVPSQNVPESKRPKSKRPKVKTSQVKTSQSQNVPESKHPKSKCPKSKRSKSKRPKVKSSQVKTSQSQNVPKSKLPKSKRPKVKTSQVKTSQNVPKSKRPKSKRPKVKTSQIKTSHLVCPPVNNITHTVMKFFIS